MIKIFKYVLPLWKRLILISFGFAAMAFLQLQIPRNVGLITNLVLADEPTSEILMTGLWMLLLSLGVIALAIGNALLNSSIATGFAAGCGWGGADCDRGGILVASVDSWHSIPGLRRRATWIGVAAALWLADDRQFGCGGQFGGRADWILDAAAVRGLARLGLAQWT